jgi:hypothetical protein
MKHPNTILTHSAPLGRSAASRVGRVLRRLHGLAYAAVAAGAMAAAGLQPPHTAEVEVGTVMVATTAGAELSLTGPAPSPAPAR